MVDSHEIVDSGGCRRIELTGVKFAFVRRHGSKGVAHIAHPRLYEIDQFQSRDCRENFNRAFGDAGHAGMFMQRDPLIDRMDEVGRSSSMRAAMYGTTCSRLKLASVLGMTISLSWMLQVGHQVSTRGAPVPANPATVLPPMRPDVLVSPARY